jgi:hypothetical protein
MDIQSGRESLSMAGRVEYMAGTSKRGKAYLLFLRTRGPHVVLLRLGGWLASG